MSRPILPRWDSHYPDPLRLRREVDSMADSFVEALLDAIPHEEIQGIYLKGSGHKEWDSPVDYVPEMSDVDVHVQFYSDESWPKRIGAFAQAMNIQRAVETAYLSKIRESLHLPRPQLMVVNKLMKDIEFIHSPRSTVKTLYGEEYPMADYSDPDHVKRVERQRLLADGAYMDGLALHVIDRPGRYMRETLRNLVWRVSPSGPRALHLLGTDTELAWSVNRTRVVSMLTELGQLDLAASYLEFYRSGWEYFLSGYEDSDAGRSTVSAAVETLTIAREIAERWLA